MVSASRAPLPRPPEFRHQAVRLVWGERPPGGSDSKVGEVVIQIGPLSETLGLVPSAVFTRDLV